jgi:hypothetical protein
MSRECYKEINNLIDINVAAGVDNGSSTVVTRKSYYDGSYNDFLYSMCEDYEYNTLKVTPVGSIRDGIVPVKDRVFALFIPSFQLKNVSKSGTPCVITDIMTENPDFAATLFEKDKFSFFTHPQSAIEVTQDDNIVLVQPTVSQVIAARERREKNQDGDNLQEIIYRLLSTPCAAAVKKGKRNVVISDMEFDYTRRNICSLFCSKLLMVKRQYGSKLDSLTVVMPDRLRIHWEYFTYQYL